MKLFEASADRSGFKLQVTGDKCTGRQSPEPATWNLKPATCNPAPATALRALILLLALAAAGCSYNASIYGLRPIEPPPRIGAMFSAANGRLEYTPVANRHPTLRWDYFMPPPAVPGSAAAPENVGYDLRVWEVRNGGPGDLVYERKGLPAPEHRVETLLKPETRYFWSVRARFEINGEARLTDWSRSKQPYRAFQRADLPGEIPFENYFRFITPGL